MDNHPLLSNCWLCFSSLTVTLPDWPSKSKRPPFLIAIDSFFLPREKLQKTQFNLLMNKQISNINKNTVHKRMQTQQLNTTTEFSYPISMSFLL